MLIRWIPLGELLKQYAILRSAASRIHSPAHSSCVSAALSTLHFTAGATFLPPLSIAAITLLITSHGQQPRSRGCGGGGQLTLRGSARPGGMSSRERGVKILRATGGFSRKCRQYTRYKRPCARAVAFPVDKSAEKSGAVCLAGRHRQVY